MLEILCSKNYLFSDKGILPTIQLQVVFFLVTDCKLISVVICPYLVPFFTKLSPNRTLNLFMGYLHISVVKAIHLVTIQSLLHVLG